jgi:hypothetical protein
MVVFFRSDTYTGFSCSLLKPRSQKRLVVSAADEEEQDNILNAVAELALSAFPEVVEKEMMGNSYSQFVPSFVSDLAWRNML